MSLGFVAAAAGTSLAQTTGADVARAQQDAANQARQVQSSEKAEQASGIGQADEDEQASERDADGRRIWEIGPDGKRRRRERPAEDASPAPPQSKDPTGNSGKQLDLSG